MRDLPFSSGGVDPDRIVPWGMSSAGGHVGLMSWYPGSSPGLATVGGRRPTVTPSRTEGA